MGEALITFSFERVETVSKEWSSYSDAFTKDKNFKEEITLIKNSPKVQGGRFVRLGLAREMGNFGPTRKGLLFDKVRFSRCLFPSLETIYSRKKCLLITSLLFHVNPRGRRGTLY